MAGQITLGGQTVTLIDMPATPGFRARDWTISDKVGGNVSPYTGSAERQAWPGADMLSCTITMPPMQGADADAWTSFLMALRGRQNGFLLGDPQKPSPLGAASGVPVVDGSVAGTNGAMAQTLYTRGWEPNTLGILLFRDWLGLGNRLYANLLRVDADANGKAALSIFPSLREAVADGTELDLDAPQGVFCLATNERKWSDDMARLTRLSFAVEEYR